MMEAAACIFWVRPTARSDRGDAEGNDKIVLLVEREHFSVV